MKKIFKQKWLLQVTLASFITVFAVATITTAATTIGTNIDTGGTLTANGLTTLGNASTTQLSVSGNSYLGAVSSGVWNGTAVGVAYGGTGATTASGARTALGLGTMAVEANTGSTTITTLGTIGTGVWNGTAIDVTKGGTGLTSAPSYGQIMVGNASSGYTLTATSSLGITQDLSGYVPYTGATGIVDLGHHNLSLNSINFYQGDPWAETFEVYANTGGILSFYNPLSYYAGNLDFTGLTDERTFTFPDWSGSLLVASSTSLTVAANGNVGIGTSTPATQLEVHAATGTSTISIISQAASTGSRIILEDSDGAGCTEIYALGGTLTSAIVACPAN